MRQPQKVDISEGLNWFGCGWELFRRAWSGWLTLLLVSLVVLFVLALIPVAGQLLVSLITPPLLGGLYVAAAKVDDGQAIDVATLFDGLRDPAKRDPLLVLGGLLVAAAVVSLLIIAVTLGGTGLFAVMLGEGGEVDPLAGISIGAGTVIGLLLAVTVELVALAGLFYAVPLVVFDNAPPLPAVLSSIDACLKNVLPLFVFGLIYLILAILAALPLGLGFIVLIPVSFCAGYCSYKSVYGR